MKILCTGDWHLRSTIPVNRKDDFLAAHFDKVQQIYKIAREHKCRVVIQPGDLFDKPNPPYYLTNMYLNFLRSQLAYKIFTIAVPGQHDQLFRQKDMGRTAWGVLDNAGVIVSATPKFTLEGVEFYGKGWGSEYPNPSVPTFTYNNQEMFKVLIAHDSVGPSDCGLPDFKTIGELAEDFAWFDLVVLGDYHYRFVVQAQGGTIINPGCIVRMTADQRDMGREPSVTVFDTETREMEEIKLNVSPAEDVFDVKHDTPHDSASLRELMDKLKLGMDATTSSFQDVLDKAVKELEKGDAESKAAAKVISQVMSKES